MRQFEETLLAMSLALKKRCGGHAQGFLPQMLRCMLGVRVVKGYPCLALAYGEKMECRQKMFGFFPILGS
jgi:hypothetical protein